MTSTMTENTITIGNVQVDVGDRISLNPDYPPVALDLLLDIVAWARHDANPKFATWGSWDQQSWAEVAIDGDLVPILRELEGKAEDPEDFETLGEIEDQANTHVESAMRANVCGTAFCMAGQAAYQSGFRLVLEDNPLDNIGGSIYASDCIAEESTGVKNDKGHIVYRDVEGAYPQPIHAVAQEALGITSDEADWLFDGDNDIDKIHAVVNRIVVDRRLPLPFPAYDVYDPAEYED